MSCTDMAMYGYENAMHRIPSKIEHLLAVLPIQN